MDATFAAELRSIPWFSNCGNSRAISSDLPLTRAASWEEAERLCSDQSWEDTTLEARNRITEFLTINHPVAYQSWNEVTRQIKIELITPLTKEIWQPFASQSRLGTIFVDCVSWDVLAAVMEREFQALLPQPRFFTQLMHIYRSGCFPCGWMGKWPIGQLVVY